MSSSSFNPYAAGKKQYSSIFGAPNVGPVSDKSGYIDRDLAAKSKRNALLRRLRAGIKGNFMSSEFLTPTQRNW